MLRRGRLVLNLLRLRLRRIPRLWRRRLLRLCLVLWGLSLGRVHVLLGLHDHMLLRRRLLLVMVDGAGASLWVVRGRGRGGME